MERHEIALGGGYILGDLCCGCTNVLTRTGQIWWKDGNMGDVEMERKRPKPRNSTKRAADKKVRHLAKLMSEVHQLRAQLQKAEAARRPH